MHQPTTPTISAVSDEKMARIRAQFPALAGETVFLENAGGSQVPGIVANAIRDYMLSSYVQLGAGYAHSLRATETVDKAHDFINLFMNGTQRGKVILGSSSSALCRMLADCYANVIGADASIVLAASAHEANVGPWLRLAQLTGATVRWWPVDPVEQRCTLETLEPLLDDSVALVAFPQVSNLLGGINDVKTITERVHEAGARVVVDGVAFAPHRAIDVEAWNVDWYVYSTYKVYGPHMAALFGSDDALRDLEGHGPNHFFIPHDEVPYKFEIGGVSHENCAGLLALGTYLNILTDKPADATPTRETIETAFDLMTACELPLQQRLIDYLQSKPGVRIVGPATGDVSRVGTISFVHDSIPAATIVAEADRRNIGIRYGHMYAYRLCEGLGIDVSTGVVRTSVVHYNTMDEVEQLIDAFEAVL